METLELLGIALGLGTLAGINLYLTVFVTGLCVRFEWIDLASRYEPLSVLADPAILWISGALFLLEFFADKVPWVDTLWDSVHTLIRPVGAALLAVTALGDANPVFDVVVGLLAGGMALTTHAAKSGTRLLVNASPEPFSNIGLSLGEDAVVLGGLALIATNPLLALVAAIAVVGLSIWLVPRVFRSARVVLWFLWKWIASLFGSRATSNGAANIPPELDIAFTNLHGDEPTILWAAPCVTGKGITLNKSIFGWLLYSEGETSSLDFAMKVESKPKIEQFDSTGCKAAYRRGFFCDKVVFYRPDGTRKQTFRFDRSCRRLVEELISRLSNRRRSPVPAESQSVSAS